jgi:hypothetical protein
MRYYPAVGPAIPRTEAGRSRVTHPFAGYPLRDPRDLHVLSTPPAFVLSQDQTLQWIVRCSSIGTTLSALSHRQRVRITYVLLSQTLPDTLNAPRFDESASHIAISTSIVNQLWCRVCGSLVSYSDLLGFASAFRSILRVRPGSPSTASAVRPPIGRQPHPTGRVEHSNRANFRLQVALGQPVELASRAA